MILHNVTWFYNWILIAMSRYPGLCLRIALSSIVNSWLVFYVKWDIKIAKKKKRKPRYIIQTSVTPVLNTNHHATHTRNIPYKPWAKPFHFLSTLTSIYVQFLCISNDTQSHSIIILHRPTQTLAISFHPIFTYLKSKPLRERRWACLPELLKLCLIYPVSLVPVCTAFWQKSFRMSRWLASHTYSSVKTTRATCLI